jgi:hypothetical protein
VIAHARLPSELGSVTVSANEVGLAVSKVSCIPPVEFWRRGIAPVAAGGDSRSVTTTPLRGAMAQTHHTQFVPLHRRERTVGAKERCGRPPSYPPAYAMTASIWGWNGKVAHGYRWTIESDLVLTADQTAPSLGRAMTNRVKASRALRSANIGRSSMPLRCIPQRSSALVSVEIPAATMPGWRAESQRGGQPRLAAAAVRPRPDDRGNV